MTLTQAETGLFVLGSIGTVLLVVSVSSSYWRTSDRYHDGLFQGCFEVNSGGRTLTECGEIKGINDKSTARLKAIRSLIIVAILAEASVLSVVIMTNMNSKNRYVAIILLNLLSVILGTTGICIYSKDFKIVTLDLGWSYGISWTAIVLNLLAVVVFGISTPKYGYRQIEKYEVAI